MSLRRVRLELARDPEFPDGSARHGYELVLPLDGAGHLDRAAWDKNKLVCTVHRFWEGEGDSVGQLVHTARGAWAFSYVPGDQDDERIHRLEDHTFREGEYVSVREPDERVRTFRVVLVRPAPGLST
jgi:hypothetical protein